MKKKEEKGDNKIKQENIFTSINGGGMSGMTSFLDASASTILDLQTPEKKGNFYYTIFGETFALFDFVFREILSRETFQFTKNFVYGPLEGFLRETFFK